MAGFDLVNVSESSPLVKKFSDAIAKATGQMVISFIAQKMKKVAGEATKDLDFNLENGQVVTLVVRTDGDVVRTKLNGRDLPLKSELFHFSADSFALITPANGKLTLAANEADRKSPAAVFAKAVAEIAERVRKSQAGFDKRRAQEKVKPLNRTVGGGSTAKSVAGTTKAVRLSLENLDKEIIEKTAIRDDLKLKVQARNTQINQVTKGVTQ